MTNDPWARPRNSSVFETVGIAEHKRIFSATPRTKERLMILASHEVPVAYSMRAMAEDLVHSASQPLQDFVCYWTAFNNIYVTVTDRGDDS